jgi:hypothetical protein
LGPTELSYINTCLHLGTLVRHMATSSTASVWQNFCPCNILFLSIHLDYFTTRSRVKVQNSSNQGDSALQVHARNIPKTYRQSFQGVWNFQLSKNSNIPLILISLLIDLPNRIIRQVGVRETMSKWSPSALACPGEIVATKDARYGEVVMKKLAGGSVEALIPSHRPSSFNYIMNNWLHDSLLLPKHLCGKCRLAICLTVKYSD